MTDLEHLEVIFRRVARTLAFPSLELTAIIDELAKHNVEQARRKTNDQK